MEMMDLGAVINSMMKARRKKERVCTLPVDLVRRLVAMDLKKVERQFEVDKKNLTFIIENIPGCGSDEEGERLNERNHELLHPFVDELEEQTQADYKAIWKDIYDFAELTEEQRAEEYTVESTTLTLFKYI